LHTAAPVIPLILLALILGLPAILIVITAHRWSYVAWMFVYLLSLPVWNFVLPTYAFWKFDDFSWGDTRKTAGEKTKKAGLEYEGEFDSSKITMRRWHDFEAGKAHQATRIIPLLTMTHRTETQNTRRGVFAAADVGRGLAAATARV
jgi:chitin synthase